jgi:Fe2+ transport system protein FeoA
MTTLNSLNRGDIATVVAIDNISEDLKYRFISFGIVKNREIKVLEKSIADKTIKIEVNSTEIAIRLDEAEKIRVKK